MACGEKWEKALSDYFDGELDKASTQELLDHIDKCPECASLAAKMEEVTGAFPELVEEPGIDIAAAALVKTALADVAGSLREANPILLNRRGPFLRRVFLAAAAVIALLAVFGITQFGVFHNTPASAEEVVALMNDTLRQLDELEVKGDLITQRGDKSVQGEMHEILKKPNMHYYSYSEKEKSYPILINNVTDGHSYYGEYTSGSAKTTPSQTSSRFGIVRPMVSSYFIINDTMESLKKKIHKELVKTNLNNRPVYRVRVNTVDEKREIEEESTFFKVVQTIWVDQETMLPMKSEWVREGEEKPYKTVDFKVFKTSGIDTSLLKVPETKTKRKGKYNWYQASPKEVVGKNPRMLPPEQIKDWKASYYAVQNFSRGGFRCGAEYQKGNDLVTVLINPLQNPEFDDRSSFSRGKVGGLQYQHVYDGFWFSSLTWQEKDRWVTIEGTIPQQELQQLALELRGSDEIKKQAKIDAARRTLLEQLQAKDEDIRPGTGNGSGLDSYKMDFLVEYTPYGEHTKVYRAIDIYRGIYDRHLEIYEGTENKGLYDLFVNSEDSQLKVFPNTTLKIEVTKKCRPFIQKPGEYTFVNEYTFSAYNAIPILHLPIMQEWFPKDWGEVSKLGEEELLNRKVEKYKVKFDMGKTGTYWVDKETNLALRLEVENPDKSRVVVKVLSLEANPIISDRLFEVNTSYQDEEVDVKGDYSVITIDEAEKRAGFKLLTPQKLPEGAWLARVLGEKGTGNKINTIYLDYRFPGNKVVLITQFKLEVEHDWRDIQHETLGGGYFQLTKGIWDNYYWGNKGNTYLNIQSTLDLDMTREIIKSLH